MIEMVFSIAFTLFLLMDPLGNIPIYLSILKECNLKKRTQIILREKVISLIIILIFAAFGDNFLKALDISHETIFLAGGIVLFVMSLKLLFPEGGSLLESLSVDGDPLIFPLAIPLVAGPSVLAAVMIYSHQIQDWKLLYIAIFLAWLASLIILLSSTLFRKIFGDRGIKAIERLMGLILMLIAINMFLQGVTLFQTSCKMKSMNETSLLK